MSPRWSLSRVAALAAAALAAACAQTPTISPDDPRAPIDRAKNEWPGRAVGIVRRDGFAGSGALVGSCTVVTSEHVLSGGGTKPVKIGDVAEFFVGHGRLGGVFAESVPAEVIALGPRAASDKFDDDWAILRLARPSGDRYGVIQPGLPDVRALSTRSLWVLGFAGATELSQYRQLTSHRNCRFVTGQGHAWLTTCASTPGLSGGPLLMLGNDSRLRVVAIMTAMRKPAPLGTREAASGANVSFSVVTGITAFAKPLRDAIEAPCPGAEGVKDDPR